MYFKSCSQLNNEQIYDTQVVTAEFNRLTQKQLFKNLCSYDHSYNWHTLGKECIYITIPLHWLPYEWTLTVLSFPRLCWLSAIISFQTCGIINKFYMYLNFIKYNVSRSNIKTVNMYEVYLWSVQGSSC